MDNDITPAATGPVSNVRLSSDLVRNPVFGDEQADTVGWQNHPLGKLLFLPTRQAFRAGGVSSEAWNRDHVGAYSWAGGYNTLASGEGSLATGFACVASGLYAVALGTENEASGNLSAAVGGFNKASGAGSFAAGANNVASGEYAVALGRGTVAASYAEFVVGSYNEQTVESADTAANRPQSTDQAFVVGIGTDKTHRRDGFAVYKDGSLGLCNLPAPPQQPAGRLYTVAGKLHFNGNLLALTTAEASDKDAPQWSFTAATNKVELDLAKQRGADVELALTKTDGGVGSKLLLQNDKQALRFGSFHEKNASNPVGQFSVSMGNDSTASGKASFAAGEGAMARGHCAVALGYQAEASGKHAFAAGADSDNKHSLRWSGKSGHGESNFPLSWKQKNQPVNGLETSMMRPFGLKRSAA